MTKRTTPTNQLGLFEEAPKPSSFNGIEPISDGKAKNSRRRKTTEDRIQEDLQKMREKAQQPQVKNQRIRYEKRPGTHLEKRNNVWWEERGENRPRASFDPKIRVYQRGVSLSQYGIVVLECLVFWQEEVSKVKALSPKIIEHIDIDHFDNHGHPIFEDMRCLRISFSDFKNRGHWDRIGSRLRWLVPLWAWDNIDCQGNLIKAGQETKDIYHA